jgi:hypothetical protein
MYAHNGFIVPWIVTLVLDNAGFTDYPVLLFLQTTLSFRWEGLPGLPLLMSVKESTMFYIIPAKGSIWRLLVVSAFLCFLSLAALCKTATCKILFRETNPGRDKNGTKPQENKVKNASSLTSLAVDFSFLCNGTILSRELQTKSYKYAVNQPFLPHGHFQEDTANTSHTDLCCLF